MKRLQSLSYKTLFAILFFSLAGIVFFLKIGGKTQKVSAAWWDEMWHYRKAISLTNSGANQTNTQIKLLTNYDLSSLVSSNKLQADLDDLRFTDINGNLMKFWIEDSTNNSADIWVVVPSLVSQTTILMYYGNSTAQSGETIMGLTSDNPGISCKAIQLSGGFSDRIYYIDPDGLEPTNAYKTYCDMTNDSGGWTLMMKAEGNTATFDYNATYWTTNNTLNPNDADINQNTDAKFESFNSLQINQIRATWPQTGHKMIETVSLITPLTLFQTTVDLGPTMVQFDYTNFPYQSGYQHYGFNLTCAGQSKVRWGWMFNNETTCDSNDTSAGIGLMNVYSTTNGGWVTCCSINKANGSYPYRVRIWGRETNVVAPNISFLSTSLQSEESGGAPIAYWKFDEGVGSTAYDSAGNNNGTISGATFISEDQCVSGKCLYFDGTGNMYVTVNDSTSLKTINSQTISMWLKPTAFGARRNPINKSYGGEGTMTLETDGSINYYWGTCGNDCDPYQGFGSNTITLNQWNLVTISRDLINNKLTWYINGKQTNQTTTSYAQATSSNNNIIIGKGYAGNFFGYIDDVKIYPYARTADQIKQDYNSRGSMSGSSVNLGVKSNTAPSLKSSLVAHYKFDEGNGTIAYNSGNGGTTLTSTLSGTTIPSWINNGKSNKALYFNGINSYVLVPKQIQDDFSISFWVKTTTTGNSGNWYAGKGLIDGEVGGVVNDFGTSISGSKLAFGIGNPDTTIYSTSDINNGRWNHIMVTRSKNTGQIKIYINGKNEATGVGNTNSLTATSNLKIGCIQTGIYYFDGSIDEVKIYNYVLTDEEIKQDYNAGSAIQFGTTTQNIGGTTTSLEYCIPGDASFCAPPIAEWKMDEGVGTSVVDTSGNNNTGTLINSPTWAQGKIGKAINFNRSLNQGVSHSTTNLTTNARTISMWLKPAFNGNDGLSHTLWEIAGGCCSANQVLLFKYSANILYWRVLTPTGTIQDVTLSTPDDTYFKSGRWMYISATYDSTGMKLYIDGKIVGSSNSITVPTTNANSIGTIGNGAYGPLSGVIDHVKIYNYARTPAQIAYDYNKGGPVGWWKFDECQGNIAYDWSGIGNTGTINIGSGGSQNSLGTCQVGTSAAWTNGSTGKINSSLNFDGTDDYIGNLKNVLATNTNSETISAWVRPNNLSGDKYIFIQNGPTLFHISNDKLAGGIYTGSWTTITSVSSLVANVWSHVVMTYDGSNIKLYINGKFDSSVAKTGNLVSLSCVEIGRFNGGDCSTGISSYFNGQLDDIRLYNYALTTEQVKQIYNGGAVNFR